MGRTLLLMSVCIHPPHFIWRNGMQTQLENLTQTRIEQLSNSRYRIRVKQNDFIAGIIDLNSSTFINSSRSPKNLFRIFNNSLGINAEILNEILPYFGIKKIIIPYLDKFLETTADRWRTLGIVSPYGDHRVDKQILLTLSKISNDPLDIENKRPLDQPSLFESV